MSDRLQWSPDGKRILYSQPDQTSKYDDLFAVDVASGKVVNLTNSPDAFDTDFSWSPDGKKVAFTSGNVTLNGLFTYGVNIMDADGTNVVELGKSLTQPSWSPDGKQLIAISSVSDNVWAIVTLNLHGTIMNRLLQTGGNKYQMFR